MSRYPNDDVERFDQQFAETEDERNERLASARSKKMNPIPTMDLTSRQKRALAMGEFHFDSGGDNAGIYREAYAMEAAGLITIRVNQYEQHATYDCAVTEAGRRALNRST